MSFGPGLQHIRVWGRQATALGPGCQAFQTCYLVSVIFTRFLLRLEMRRGAEQSGGGAGRREGSWASRGISEWVGSREGEQTFARDSHSAGALGVQEKSDRGPAHVVGCWPCAGLGSQSCFPLLALRETPCHVHFTDGRVQFPGCSGFWQVLFQGLPMFWLLLKLVKNIRAAQQGQTSPSVDLPNDPSTWVFVTFYNWGNWGLTKLRDFSEGQLFSGKARSQLRGLLNHKTSVSLW